MKEISWTGPELNTRYGLMALGKIVTIPDKDADSYIAQNLAVSQSADNDSQTEEIE